MQLNLTMPTLEEAIFACVIEGVKKVFNIYYLLVVVSLLFVF